MGVKLSFKNLNPGPYLSHSTNIYTCEVTTAPRVRNGYIFSSLIYIYIYIYIYIHTHTYYIGYALNYLETFL